MYVDYFSFVKIETCFTMGEILEIPNFRSNGNPGFRQLSAEENTFFGIGAEPDISPLSPLQNFQLGDNYMAAWRLNSWQEQTGACIHLHERTLVICGAFGSVLFQSVSSKVTCPAWLPALLYLSSCSKHINQYQYSPVALLTLSLYSSKVLPSEPYDPQHSFGNAIANTNDVEDLCIRTWMLWTIITDMMWILHN